MPLSAKILFSQVYTGLPLIPIIPPRLTAFLLFFRLFLPLNGGHRFRLRAPPHRPGTAGDTTGHWHKVVPSQGLSDLLVEELKKNPGKEK